MTGENSAGSGSSISWDEYFMGIALFTSLRSRDPNSKVGSVLVNERHHIVGTGYNGFVAGADESRFSWQRDGDWINTKYPYVVHAEANAILNSTINDLQNCRIYATLYPCNECAKQIAQKKISEVIYLSDKYHGKDFRQASETIFSSAGIAVRQLELPSLQALLNRFKEYLP